jgi:hypothetical protein
MRKYPLFIAAILFVGLGHISIEACSCIRLDETEEQRTAGLLKESAAVFSGETIKLEKIPGTRDLIATFAVEEFWKGELAATVEVRTAMDGASCGYNFQIGAAYLVYAFKAPNGLSTGLCGGNGYRYDTFAKDQIKFLGKGKVPEKKPE